MGKSTINGVFSIAVKLPEGILESCWILDVLHWFPAKTSIGDDVFLTSWVHPKRITNLLAEVGWILRNCGYVYQPEYPRCIPIMFGKSQDLRPRTNTELDSKIIKSQKGYSYLGMDQYLLYNTIFRGMNIHLPAILMFTRGTRFWHTAT